ncbi:MAG: hypothetical protein IKO65_07040 [Victivallales bacterium]|nr:hypothetical protein [Victivallales bacterium]
MNMSFPINIFLELETDGLCQRLTLDPTNAQTIEFEAGSSRFRVFVSVPCEKRIVTLECLHGEGELYATLVFRIGNWSSANYLLLPSAVYGGNRVSVVAPNGSYPPKFPDGYMNLTPPQLTGTIQHLAPQGGGQLDMTSAEGAFPGLGFYSEAKQESVWLLTPQANEAGNYGYIVIEADDALDVRITSPVHRTIRQIGCNTFVTANDAPLAYRPGTTATFEFALLDKWCCTLEHFFQQARELRNAAVPSGAFPNLLPYSEATRLVRDRLEADNWFEEYGYYSTITKTDLKGICRNSTHQWQLGWVGGIMKTEYLLREGEPQYRSRIYREWDTLFAKAQCESGFFLTTAFHDCFFPDWPPQPGEPLAPWALVRKNADALAFLARQLLWLKLHDEPIQPQWLDGFRKCADAFVHLWEKHGQFGYLIAPATGELLVGGGVGGASAITGLALASELLHEPKYLETAIASAYYYAENYLQEMGNVYGGVGDALQATDSESAYALLEALVTVWEYTHDESLLALACSAADYLSTWIVSYDYRFPPESTFGKLNMHTAGTVYANIQNRHSAPGFCSASGDALFKLYRATGRTEYGRLAREVVHALPQFLSRPGRVIYGMEVVGMSERVNIGDWEGASQVGEIGNAPCACWPEVALLLARVHLPGVYARTDTREILCFDHLEAKWDGDTLQITNPTDYPAEVTLLVEDDEAVRLPLFTTAYEHFRKIEIPSHGTVAI